MRIAFLFCTIFFATARPSFGQQDFGHWEIGFHRSTPDTLYVTARIVSEFSTPAPSACRLTTIVMAVTPCALSLSGAFTTPVECDNGTSNAYVFAQGFPVDGTFIVGLLRPGTYTFDGSFSFTYFSDPLCENFSGSFVADLSPVTVNTEALPIRPMTWGRVKALYRN